MKEIDIIELLKRVKEGKAPKEIQILGKRFILKDLVNPPIDHLYYLEDEEGDICNWFKYIDIHYNTKIKILDKPIIEELKPNRCYFKDGTERVYKEMYSKINEIIKVINEENKDE